jgi:hypothetical protein
METFIFGVVHLGHPLARLLAQKAHKVFKVLKEILETLVQLELQAE